MSIASQCSLLPEAPHSNITILNGGGRSYGTIVRFECEPGYVRSGHPVILCMSNGTWSDEVPTCSRGYLIYSKQVVKQFVLMIDSRVGAKCPLLPTIKNGFVVDTNREYFYGDEARVQCNRGYKLSGSNIIQCGPNQRFDNVPTCEGRVANIRQICSVAFAKCCKSCF